MGEFEDILEQLREGTIDSDDAAERLEKFKGSSLRKKAEERDEFEKRAIAAEAKAAKLEAAPKTREAFEKYGIDFENLRKAERALVEKYDGELTDEAIAEFVEENELPVLEGEESGEAEERSDAEKIATTAKTAGSKSSSRVPKLTPADVEAWSAEKWVRFADANPDAAEALRRGEEVTGVTA